MALAYLVLNRNRTIARDELMEHLWTDPDPQRVASSLTQTLSRLRKALGPESLERLPGGAVRLRGEFRLDIETAHAALEDGRQACDAGAWTSARAASDTVLARLAGEVLAGDEAEWLEACAASSAAACQGCSKTRSARTGNVSTRRLGPSLLRCIRTSPFRLEETRQLASHREEARGRVGDTRGLLARA